MVLAQHTSCPGLQSLFPLQTFPLDLSHFMLLVQTLPPLFFRQVETSLLAVRFLLGNVVAPTPLSSSGFFYRPSKQWPCLGVHGKLYVPFPNACDLDVSNGNFFFISLLFRSYSIQFVFKLSLGEYRCSFECFFFLYICTDHHQLLENFINFGLFQLTKKLRNRQKCGI